MRGLPAGDEPTAVAPARPGPGWSASGRRRGGVRRPGPVLSARLQGARSPRPRPSPVGGAGGGHGRARQERAGAALAGAHPVGGGGRPASRRSARDAARGWCGAGPAAARDRDAGRARPSPRRRPAGLGRPHRSGAWAGRHGEVRRPRCCPLARPGARGDRGRPDDDREHDRGRGRGVARGRACCHRRGRRRGHGTTNQPVHAEQQRVTIRGEYFGATGRFAAASGAKRGLCERQRGSASRQQWGVRIPPGSATVGEDLGRGGVTPSPALVPVVCRPRRADPVAVRSCVRRAPITALEVAWTSSSGAAT